VTDIHEILNRHLVAPLEEPTFAGDLASRRWRSTPSRTYFRVRAPAFRAARGRDVYDGPTRVFTILRFRCSQWTDPSVDDGPKPRRPVDETACYRMPDR